jgi:hypothetical protein
MLVPSALRGQSCTTSTGTDALVWTRCAGAPGASPCLLPQLSAPPSNVSSVHDILGIQSQEQLLLLEQQQQPQVPPHLLLPPAEQLPLQDAATQRAAPRPPPLIIPAAQQLHQGAGPLHYPHNSSLPQHESRAHQATAPTLQQQRARQRPPSSGAPTPSPALTGARTSVTPALRGMALADTPRSARASSAGGAEAGGEGGSQADDATLSNQLRRSRRLSSASSVVSSVAAATPSGGGVSALLAAGRQYVCVTCGALWGLLDVTDMSIFVCTAQVCACACMCAWCMPLTKPPHYTYAFLSASSAALQPSAVLPLPALRRSQSVWRHPHSRRWRARPLHANGVQA